MIFERPVVAVALVVAASLPLVTRLIPHHSSGHAGSARAIAPQRIQTGARVGASAVPEHYFSSIVWCVMENHGFDQVKELASHRFLMRHGAVLARYRDIGHPSGPNYRVIVSGEAWCPDEVFGQAEPSVATELRERGIRTLDWQVWGKPDLKHDPYHDLLNPVETRVGPFNPEQLPPRTQVYLGADDNNNAHDGPLSAVDRNLTDLIQRLDRSRWFNTPDKQGRYPVLAVTWDESFRGDDRVFTAFYGHGVKPGYVSNRSYTHFNLCRTLTDNWGMPALGQAAKVAAIDDVWK